ncbi:Uma2 family endonuclease [Pendulispora brunnea]|uniref:Uma2 family endonuclease n=1 Tax=Pendulispora brunnea TaxID=2905690 RepID=A0ABZ2KEA2_9BACT
MNSVSVEDVAPDQIRPLLRVEYDRLVAAGAFEGERLELLRGRLVLMSPQHGPHASTVSRLNHCLLAPLEGRAEVRIQLPLSLSDDSEPEPDVAVVPLGDYDNEHPQTALWVIEVADSSLKKDRELKPGIYAQADVPDYWVVNLLDRIIEVHREPAAGVYQTIARYREGDTIAPLAFSDLAIEVSRILPRKAQ